MNIDRGIPVPEFRMRGRWVKLSCEMKAGESVLLDTYPQYMAMQQAFSKRGMKTISRSEPSGKIRAWYVGPLPEVKA